MKPNVRRSEPTLRQLDRELDLVAGTIRLVASGEASSVRLGGLRFGVQILDEAQAQARAAGVELSALWTASDEGPIGLLVERSGDAVP